MIGENVSNEQLIDDYNNTKLEAEAYEMLAKGYDILAKLPENAGAQARTHSFKADGFRNSAEACRKFLIKLEKLMGERGI